MESIYIPSTLSSHLQNLWKNSLPNIEKMLNRRQYEFNSDLQNGFIKFTSDDKDCLLFLFFSDKLGIEIMRDIIHFSEMNNIKHIILIIQNTYSSNCKKVIDNLLKYKIEIFELREFQYDITKLYYFIPHYVVKDEQLIANIKEKYSSNLPVILKTDKIVQYFGFDKGNIVQIHRKDNGHDETICYRIIK